MSVVAAIHLNRGFGSTDHARMIAQLHILLVHRNQSLHSIEQRFTQQRLNLPALGDGIPGEQAVLARVLVCLWRAGSLCAAGRAPPESGTRRRDELR
jgi:hypothetical protein